MTRRDQGVALMFATIVVAVTAALAAALLAATRTRHAKSDERVAEAVAFETARSAATRALARLRAGASAAIGGVAADRVPLDLANLDATSRKRLPTMNGGVYYSALVTQPDGTRCIVAGAQVGRAQAHLAVDVTVTQAAEGHRLADVGAWREVIPGK